MFVNSHITRTKRKEHHGKDQRHLAIGSMPKTMRLISPGIRASGDQPAQRPSHPRRAPVLSRMLGNMPRSGSAHAFVNLKRELLTSGTPNRPHNPKTTKFNFNLLTEYLSMDWIILWNKILCNKVHCFASKTSCSSFVPPLTVYTYIHIQPRPGPRPHLKNTGENPPRTTKRIKPNHLLTKVTSSR